MVEHSTDNRKVAGSNPASSTRIPAMVEASCLSCRHRPHRVVRVNPATGPKGRHPEGPARKLVHPCKPTPRGHPCFLKGELGAEDTARSSRKEDKAEPIGEPKRPQAAPGMQTCRATRQRVASRFETSRSRAVRRTRGYGLECPPCLDGRSGSVSCVKDNEGGLYSVTQKVVEQQGKPVLMDCISSAVEQPTLNR